MSTLVVLEKVKLSISHSRDAADSPSDRTRPFR